MGGNRFGSLLDLVSLDQEVHVAEKQYEALIQNVEAFESAKQSLLSNEQTLKLQIQELQKTVNVFELDMKTLDTRETQNKKQLDTIHSLKEYNSLKAELDTIHTEQQRLEQELISAWNKLEHAQEELQKYSKSLDGATASHDESITSTAQSMVALAARIKELREKRPAYEQLVPAEWLEKYSIMRAQVPNPVVLLVEGSCSVCFNHMTMQDALRIQRGALMQCKGCYRLLYTPDIH